MRNLLKLFLWYFLVFILLLSIGLYNGLKKRDAHLKNKIISNLKYTIVSGNKLEFSLPPFRANKNEVTNRKKPSEKLKEISRKPLIPYYTLIIDPDKDGPREQIVVQYKDIYKAEKPDLEGLLRTHETMIWSILGAASGKLTLDKFMKHAKKINGKKELYKIIGAVFGGALGYGLGLYLGERVGTELDSKKTKQILYNKNDWIEIERQYMILIMGSIKIKYPNILKCNIREMEHIRKIYKKAEDTGYNFGSIDIISIIKFNKKCEKIEKYFTDQKQENEGEFVNESQKIEEFCSIIRELFKDTAIYPKRSNI